MKPTWNGEPFDPRTESPWESEDGIARRYHPNGILWSETRFVNGQRHGTEKHYNPDGSLLFEIPYANGKQHGIEKWYYQDGSVQLETSWVNGGRRFNLSKLERIVLFGEQQ